MDRWRADFLSCCPLFTEFVRAVGQRVCLPVTMCADINSCLCHKSEFLTRHTLKIIPFDPASSGAVSIMDSDIGDWFERDCSVDMLDPAAAMPV